MRAVWYSIACVCMRLALTVQFRQQFVQGSSVLHGQDREQSQCEYSISENACFTY